MPAQLDKQFLNVASDRTLSRLVGYTLFEGRPLTTRGRWWNPVVFTHLKLAAHFSHGEIEDPIFIVGMGRSGTTLLGRILASHPDIGYLNEPKAIWHVITPDEDVIGSYSSTNTAKLYLDATDAGTAVKQRANSLYSWYLRLSGSRRVVDKYPELVFRIPFVRALFPRARFLVAVRSPQAVVRSVEGWSRSHAVDHADWWGLDSRKWRILWHQAVTAQPKNHDIAKLSLESCTDDTIRAAIEWIVSTREALQILEPGDDALLVSYDQLIDYPEATISRISSFLNLAPSERPAAFARRIITPAKGSQSERGYTESPLPHELRSIMDDVWRDLNLKL